jgi:hypothetical protein
MRGIRPGCCEGDENSRNSAGSLTVFEASGTMKRVRALSSAVRAFGLHPKGRPFKSDSAHHPCATPFSGDVVQLVRTLPCHGRGREFESRRPRHSFQAVGRNTQFPPWSNMVQLDHCLRRLQHHFHHFALRKTFFRHPSLCIQIESNPAVGVTQQFLHDLHVLVVLR